MICTIVSKNTCACHICLWPSAPSAFFPSLWKSKACPLESHNLFQNKAVQPKTCSSEFAWLISSCCILAYEWRWSFTLTYRYEVQYTIENIIISSFQWYAHVLLSQVTRNHSLCWIKWTHIYIQHCKISVLWFVGCTALNGGPCTELCAIFVMQWHGGSIKMPLHLPIFIPLIALKSENCVAQKYAQP